MSTGNQSEVARLRQKIDELAQAFHLGFTGYAAVTRHDVITAKMEQLQATQQELASYIGEDAATKWMCEGYTRAMEEEPNSN